MKEFTEQNCGISLDYVNCAKCANCLFKFFTIISSDIKPVPPWYLYLVVVEWLACLNDPESYASGGIAARRVTHARQDKGDKPDEKVPWSL